MSKNFLYSATFFIILLVGGCSAKEVKTPLEDVGMVGIMAVDYIDASTIQLTVAIPQYSPEAEQDTQIFSVPTELMSNGIVKIETLSDKKIVFNQLRVVLINEEFARKGDVEKVIQYLYRNAEVGNKVLLAIVKEHGEEMLKTPYPDKPNINFYLSDLLQPSINTAFNPNTNVHDFIYTITNPVFDPIIPLLEQRNGKIEITGVALFKDKNMYEMITPEDALTIQALLGRKKLAPLKLELHQGHDKEKLMLDLIESKVKMTSNKSMESPKLTIFLKIKGTLAEFKGAREDDLNTADKIANLEDDINKQLEEDFTQFLEKLNDMKIDPSGLSEHFRMYYKGKWGREKTEEILSKLEMDVQVETSIISTGTLK